MIKTTGKGYKNAKFVEPINHADKASKTTIRIWEKEVDAYVKRKETYDINKCTLYAVV